MSEYEFGEWTIWNGGDCPVDKPAMVQVQLRCESREEAERCDVAGCHMAGIYIWHHSNGPGDIIAYRTVTKVDANPPREVWLRRGYPNHWYPSYKGEEGAVLFREVTE